MNVTGMVISTDKNKAVVSSQRSSACASCHNCASHGMCHAELIFGNQTETVEVCAENIAGARKGDKVELESSTGKTLFSAFFLFVFPLIITLGLYFVLRQSIGSYEGMPVVMLVVCFLTFAFSAFVLNIFVKRHTSISIVRIIEECNQDFEGK